MSENPPARIRVWQNEPNGEFVASFPGDLYLDENTEYVRADIYGKLVGALTLIDALDPEDHVYRCSPDALRGLVIQMGQHARAALASLEQEPVR